jgi:replicative DNA helicase
MNLEEKILSGLFTSEEYSRKTVPFLKPEYFQDQSHKLLFEVYDNYIQKYNKLPTREAVIIEINNKNGLSEETVKNTNVLIKSLSNTDDNLEWMLDKTEAWCQERAVYNAIMTSIQILDDKKGIQSKGSIPKILSDALAVSFDTNIGHDFLINTDERYQFYHTKEVKIPFDLEYMNSITGGGLPRKTLNIAIAGTGVGKSLFMCHCASANLFNGLNVLYITLEMSEERIAERIDANMMDVTMDELKLMPKDVYDKKIERIRNKTTGKLIIKEYPTACAGSANFRHLINELKLKKNFMPDIIYIDYLNICMSSRIKNNGNANSYTIVKTIAEELRGLAVEFNVPIVSATQVNRSGFADSDFGLENTSESFGLPATADLMFALIATEELNDLGQIMIKQLKNRYGDPNLNKRFVVGIDRAKMKLYDTEQSSQDDIMDGPKSNKSVFDNTGFGMEDEERGKPKKKFNKSLFDGFK